MSRKPKDQRANNALIGESLTFKGRLRASAEAGGETEQKLLGFHPLMREPLWGEVLLCRDLKTSIFLTGARYREFPECRSPEGVVFVVNLGLLCKSGIEE